MQDYITLLYDCRSYHSIVVPSNYLKKKKTRCISNGNVKLFIYIMSYTLSDYLFGNPIQSNLI